MQGIPWMNEMGLIRVVKSQQQCELWKKKENKRYWIVGLIIAHSLETTTTHSNPYIW